MRNLEASELNEVGGGEILFAPNEIGIAVTENSLLVIGGTADAAALLGAAGAIIVAAEVGWAIGTFIREHTGIDEALTNWMYSVGCGH